MSTKDYGMSIIPRSESDSEAEKIEFEYNILELPAKYTFSVNGSPKQTGAAVIVAKLRGENLYLVSQNHLVSFRGMEGICALWHEVNQHEKLEHEVPVTLSSGELPIRGISIPWLFPSKEHAMSLLESYNGLPPGSGLHSDSGFRLVMLRRAEGCEGFIFPAALGHFSKHLGSFLLEIYRGMNAQGLPAA